MVMVIFPEIVRKNQKRILKKRMLINGIKFKNQVFPIRTIERKEKKEKLGMESLLMGRASLKLGLLKIPLLLLIILLF